ncbi:MAG: hypothetical protein ABI743_00315 [bacterium]
MALEAVSVDSSHNAGMTWQIRTSEEFRDWFLDLSVELKVVVGAAIEILESDGPDMPFAEWPETYSLGSGAYVSLCVPHEGDHLEICGWLDSGTSSILLGNGWKPGDPRVVYC